MCANKKHKTCKPNCHKMANGSPKNGQTGWQPCHGAHTPFHKQCWCLCSLALGIGGPFFMVSQLAWCPPGLALPWTALWCHKCVAPTSWNLNFHSHVQLLHALWSKCPLAGVGVGSCLMRSNATGGPGLWNANGLSHWSRSPSPWLPASWPSAWPILFGALVASWFGLGQPTFNASCSAQT